MGEVMMPRRGGSKSIMIGSLNIGDSLYLPENQIWTEYLVVHQGRPSALYDTSCDGTWLLRKDILENRQWHSSNTNDYANSTIHSYLNSTFLSQLGSNIQAAIKQVKIPYVNGTANSAVASGANGLSAKVFLLSGYEAGFTTSVNQYFPVDGAKLSYFISGNDASAQAKRIANLNGKSTRWWLRSPNTSSSINAWHVNSTGRYDCSHSYGVRPALILPSTLTVPVIPKDLSAVVVR